MRELSRAQTAGRGRPELARESSLMYSRATDLMSSTGSVPTQVTLPLRSLIADQPTQPTGTKRGCGESSCRASSGRPRPAV